MVLSPASDRLWLSPSIVWLPPAVADSMNPVLAGDLANGEPGQEFAPLVDVGHLPIGCAQVRGAQVQCRISQEGRTELDRRCSVSGDVNGSSPYEAGGLSS